MTFLNICICSLENLWFISLLQVFWYVFFFYQKFVEPMINRNKYHFEELIDELIFGLYHKGIWCLFTMVVKFRFDFCLIFVWNNCKEIKDSWTAVASHFLSPAALYESVPGDLHLLFILFERNLFRFVICIIEYWCFFFPFIARKPLVFQLK